MKIRAVVLVLCILMSMSFVGCKKQDTKEQTELIVFAAASMTETLTELGEKYMAEHGDIKITFNFDSSGTLKTQIQEGAVCDIFVSAGLMQMDRLDASADSSANPEGLDYILENSRVELLENKIALVVPEGNPAGVESFADLAERLEKGDIMLAMGNSDVPAGQYMQKILDYFGLDEAAIAASGCITYSSNVKEIATQTAEASVDCGVIYQTDAYSAGLTVVDTASAEMCGRVVYPAAVIKNSANTEAAGAFLEYLASDTADEIFEKVGFTPAA